MIVVGAGPAGLSAALILARCRRRVAVFDSGEYRNARTAAMHGFVSRDGIAPAEFRRVAREQLQAYPDATLVHGRVLRARSEGRGFNVEISDGGPLFARALVLATGVVDELPALPGIGDIYGTSAFHCPYCDAWEWRERRIAVYGTRARAFAMANELKIWSDDISVCLDEPSQSGAVAQERQGVHLQPVVRLDSEGGLLSAIHFADGS